MASSGALETGVPPVLIRIGNPETPSSSPQPSARPASNVAELASTAMLPSSAFTGEPPASLPFHEPEVAAPSHRMSPEIRVRAVPTGTRVASEAQSRQTLPFQRKRGARVPGENLPGWTVERYATLCIDLHASGRSRVDVFREYQLTDASFTSLDAFWEDELARHPQIHRRWAEASAEHRKKVFGG